MFERVQMFNCTTAAVSISCIVIKKNVKVKHINTNLFKDLPGNTLTWNISLMLTTYSSHKKLSFKIYWLTKNLFRLNIFAIYFPLKLIIFTVHIISIRTFSLYQTKAFLLLWKELMLIVSIVNASLNIDWLASFSSCKLLIGLFEFNRKPVERACY